LKKQPDRKKYNGILKAFIKSEPGTS